MFASKDTPQLNPPVIKAKGSSEKQKVSGDDEEKGQEKKGKKEERRNPTRRAHHIKMIYFDSERRIEHSRRVNRRFLDDLCYESTLNTKTSLLRYE